MQAAEHCEVMSVALLDSRGHVPKWVGSSSPCHQLFLTHPLSPDLEPLQGQTHKAHILGSLGGPDSGTDKKMYQISVNPAEGV